MNASTRSDKTSPAVRAAVRWASAAAAATAAVGAVALTGVERLPVLEYLLFPGSMAAWMFRGDDYASSREFLVFAILFGVPINAALGAALGALKARLVPRMRDGR